MFEKLHVHTTLRLKSLGRLFIFNNYLLEMRFKYLPSSKFIRNYKLINLINSETFYFFLKCIYTRKRELKPSLS